MKQTYHRGEVFMADLGVGIGSEQHGFRPVVIVQNDIGNRHSPTVIVAAVTSKAFRKTDLPTHFLVNGLPERPSLVLCEQLRTLDKRRLKTYLGRLTREELAELDITLAVSMGLAAPKKNKKDGDAPLLMTLCPSCADSFRWDGQYHLQRVGEGDKKDICTYCGQRLGCDYEVIRNSKNSS